MVGGPAGGEGQASARRAFLEPLDEPEERLPRKLLRFLGLALKQAHEASILLTASALAFVTILSLIPLLAAFSFVGARVFNQYQERSLEVFIQVLPYSEQSVVDKLGEFLEQAESLHGFGVAAFFFVTLLAFATVEETINKIWHVTRQRPLRVRVISFALLIFWAPLLIGATFSSVIVLRQSPALKLLFEESILLHVLPFAATIVGLTMLYWRVPFTTVHFRNALAGGLFAGILLELLRQGFGLYVEFFRTVNVVYGSFAFALLFIISIELTWAIVLFGSEIAYTAQYFPALSAGSHHNPPLQASWLGLAIIALIAERMARGEPPLSHEALAGRLRVSGRELERVVNPLLSHDLLRPTKAARQGYVLAVAPERLPLERVFQAYDHRARRVVQAAGGELRTRLEALVNAMAEARRERLGDLSLAEFLAGARLPHQGETGTMPRLPSVGQ